MSTTCPGGRCGGDPGTRLPTLQELANYDVAEEDRQTLLRGRDARRLRSLAGGGQAPAQPPLPPALELVDGDALVAGSGRPRRRGGSR